MGNRITLLYLTLFFSIVFAGLQFLAMAFDLYWVYWWFDWMMHFLAGLIGGLAIFWVLYYSWFWRRKTDKLLLPTLSIVGCLLIVGALWEVAEYIFDITDAHERIYIHDVRNDLIADTIGAFIASFIGLKVTRVGKGNTRNTNV